MPSFKTILVVDDSAADRSVLSHILSQAYTVLAVKNGELALAALAAHHGQIAAVLLDLVMPVMDGYAVLAAVRSDRRYDNLPVLVAMENSDSDSEIRALSLGAWDFVSKPYNPEIIQFRLKNAIDKSQIPALRRLQYLADYDSLTGIYHKARFFEATREMLDAQQDKNFAFLRFDVDRFQLVNSFFGTEEGDKLLLYIADRLRATAQVVENMVYGRIESDIFACCIPDDPELVARIIGLCKQALVQYNENYDVVPSVGVYLIDERGLPVEEMYNRAALAAKTCKGNYVEYYAYYNENMSLALTHEQEIVNDMNFALANQQFEIYLQPQYNIHTNQPCGGEVLVRWQHPQKGMLLPKDFIPVFERNGFITKLDYYVWERACQCLQRWQAHGNLPFPLSVNVSRVNLYNPNLAEMLLALVTRYQVAPSLLNLELTESAYTDNPVAMKKTMDQLQHSGFVIMMDDFGSGYSSLSVLKDILVDVLKIDMRFLTKTQVPGRGENIIASVIRMAKWLNIPVIAEGAETAEQVSFLRSVGCDYVQGYFFARPMPVADYEQLFPACPPTEGPGLGTQEGGRYQDLFSANQDLALLFGNTLQAAAIYEFVDDEAEVIRVNEAYYALLGHDDMLTRSPNVLALVEEEHQGALLHAFHTCVTRQDTAECEYLRYRKQAPPIWLRAKLRYVSTIGGKHIIIGELTDVTVRRQIDSELQQYKAALFASSRGTHTVLIVDDDEGNRAGLREILQDKFHLFQAENGLQGLELLKTHSTEIDLILLDMAMPIMDGAAFLQHKRALPALDNIPVIMMTADDTPAQQISSFALDVSDYIVRPFVPQVVLRRVGNVLESSHRFREMVREYNSMSEQVKTDLMTGLINRVSAEEMITKRLEADSGTCAMLMLDIDNFKTLNDSWGHAYGDQAISAVAEKLRTSFRQNDIIARMGGDEFAVFMVNIPGVQLVEEKALALCHGIEALQIAGKSAGISCSVGVAISSDQAHSFDALYKNADNALYNAKFQGRNTVLIYGQASAAIPQSKWAKDAEHILASFQEGLYICDKESYELIYANKHICSCAGVTQEACRGKKCYEALMHSTHPCACCSMSQLPQSEVCTRLLRAPDGTHTYLLRGKDMNRNGVIAHVEVVLDVTDVIPAKQSLEEMNGLGTNEYLPGP